MTDVSTRRLLGWAVVVLAVLMVVAAVLTNVLDDDDEEDGGTVPSSITLPEPAAAGLDAGGAELVGLLAAGRDRTYHARYSVTGPDVGGDSSLEVWQDDERLRTDTELRTPEGASVHTAGFRLADGTVSCVQRDAEAWACSTAEPTPGGGDVFGTVEEQVKGASVTARDDSIDGRQARCFDFESADGPVTTCLSADGVPVLLSGGGSEIRLVELDDDVPDSVFTPPAG